MDVLRGGSTRIWSTQVDRDPISYRIFLKHLKRTPGYSTFLWSKFPLIHWKTVDDSTSVLMPSLPMVIICLAECWTLADKGQRNAGVSDSVGRSGDLSPAGDGDVTMGTEESQSALWPPIYLRPQKWDFPICMMLNALSTLCHHSGREGEKGTIPAKHMKIVNRIDTSSKWSKLFSTIWFVCVTAERQRKSMCMHNWAMIQSLIKAKKHWLQLLKWKYDLFSRPLIMLDLMED